MHAIKDSRECPWCDLSLYTATCALTDILGRRKCLGVRYRTNEFIIIAFCYERAGLVAVKLRFYTVTKHISILYTLHILIDGLFSNLRNYIVCLLYLNGRLSSEIN